MDAETAERLRARIEACRSIDGPRLERAISRMLGEIDDVTRRWASFACASNGDRLGSHRDDVHNLIRIEVAAVIRTMVEPPPSPTRTPTSDAPPQIRNLPAYLRRVAARTAYAYFHSTAFTGLGGGSGPARRAGALHVARREFAERHGRPPSDAELVDEVNHRARRTRRDPVKQGALVTVADVRTAPPLSLDALPLLEFELGAAAWVAPALDTPDAALERIDAERLIARTLEVCAAVSTPLGTAARLWIGDALADPPVIGAAPEIAARMGIAVATADDLLNGCRTVASTIANAEFDVTSPFG